MATTEPASPPAEGDVPHPGPRPAARTSWVLVVLCLLSVAALGTFVAIGDAARWWDAGVDRWVLNHQIGLTPAARVLSASAQADVGVGVLLLVGVIAAINRSQWWPLVAATVTALVLVVSVYAIKHEVVHVHDALHPGADADIGFPSGHATTAVVMGGSALVLLSLNRSARTRRWCLVLLTVYGAAVGAARLYLGVHHLSDVVGGWLLGVAIIVSLALLVAKQTLDKRQHHRRTDAAGLREVTPRRTRQSRLGLLRTRNARSGGLSRSTTF